MMTFAVTCRKMPSAELVVFPGVGHGLMYQCPDRFCETVLGFLK
ncbi:alpha/beta fold hydrolase [Methanoregula sp.]